MQSLDAIKQNNCLTNISTGTTLLDIKSKITNLTITSSLNDNDILKTGDQITFSDDVSTITYSIAIKGDVDGDGKISANDYVKIKNYIMEISGSELDVAKSIAADVDNNGAIGSADYVKIKNVIMER